MRDSTLLAYESEESICLSEDEKNRIIRRIENNPDIGVRGIHAEIRTILALRHCAWED